MFGLDGISGVLSRGVLVLACVVLVIASIDARAQVVCVDATRGRAGASGSCAPGPDGYWSDPFSSLAEALAESSEGEEVWVAAGTYEEEGLALPSRVTLSGGFAGHESSPLERDRWAHRVFVSTPAAAPEPVVLDLLGDARVEEITVFSSEQGAGSGLRVLCAAQRAGGIVSLEGVIARDLREGLLLEMVSGEETQGCEIRARVERCVFLDNLRGIWGRVKPGGYAEMSEVVEITESVFDGNAEYGALMEPALPPARVEVRFEVRDSLVTGSDAGFAAHNRSGSGFFSARNVLAFANRSGLEASSSSPYRDASGAPMRVDGRDYSWDMQLLGNTLVGNDYGLSFHQDDLVAEHEIWRNYAVGNRVDGILHGNASGNAKALVEDNWLLDNGRAGFHHAPHVCGVRHFRRNRITGNLRGLWSRDNGCERFVVGGREEWRNDLSANSEYSLAYDGLSVLDAEWNFWGHDEHSAIQSTIAPQGGPVDFVPWYWPAGGGQAEGGPRFVEVYARGLRPAAISLVPGSESAFTLAWVVDTDNSGARIAEMEATLRWDPRLVDLESWKAGPAGFDVRCEADRRVGVLSCAADRTGGVEGLLETVHARFRGALPFAWTPHFDIEVQRLEGQDGEDLLPIVMSHDDVVGWPL